jgi:hypothetical protein
MTTSIKPYDRASVCQRVIQVDCTELTKDEELALASGITAALSGKGMAFVKGEKLALDDFGSVKLDETVVESAIRDFVSRRKDAEFYSITRKGDLFVVHSADPIKARHSRDTERLPPNVFKCPFCGFITPYEELYTVHYRSHGFV